MGQVGRWDQLDSKCKSWRASRLGTRAPVQHSRRKAPGACILGKVCEKTAPEREEVTLDVAWFQTTFQPLNPSRNSALCNYL